MTKLGVCARVLFALPARLGVLCLTSALIVAVFGLHRAHAYRTAADLGDYGEGPVRWATDDITLSVIGSPPVGLSADDVTTAVNAAVQTWVAPSCHSLHLEFVEDGGDIQIEWLHDEWALRGFDTTSVGTTQVMYEGAGADWTIVGARIYLNATGFTWTRDATGEEERDARVVITHELGHALGLLHVCERGSVEAAPDCRSSETFRTATMYPDYLGPAQADLSPDDEAGICFLYGSGPACAEAACDGGLTEDAGVVGPDPGERLAGDPCRLGAQCASGYCSSDGYCTGLCSSSASCPDDFECRRPGYGEPSECTPQGGVLGTPCESGVECHTGLCAVHGDSSHCTRTCSSTGPKRCPPGYACGEVDGRAVCKRAASGCAATGRAAGGEAIWMLMGLTILWTRRRRLRPVVVLGVCIALLACGDDGTVTEESDSGAPDATAAADSGLEDASPPSDGGSARIDAGPEPCGTEGELRVVDCGNCGLASETCSADLVWERASECLDEGECAPGEVETEALEMCATRSRICDETCAWRDWTVTGPAEPECDTGDTRVARGACTSGGEEHHHLVQECDDSCEWVSTSMCHDGCTIEGTCRIYVGVPCYDDSYCGALSCDEDGYCTRECSTDSHCPDGFRCLRRTPGGPASCRAQGATIGKPCTESGDCIPLHVCFRGICTRDCDGFLATCPRGMSCERTSPDPSYLPICLWLPEAE